MSKYDSEYTKNILSRIIGEKIQEFFFEDRTLILYLAIASDNEFSKQQWDLWIDCAWRLDNGEKVIAAYFDSADFVKPILAELKGTTLTEIKYESVSQDLKLNFSNGMRLKVFTYSTMDKQWELRGANGYKYGIGPNLSPYEQMESEPNER